MTFSFHFLPVRIFRPAIAVAAAMFLLGASPARAHHGFESVIDVRLLGAQTFVIIRVAVSVASQLLGDGSPTAWSDAVVAQEQARLQAVGADLLTLQAGSMTLRPVSTRAALEVSGQIAFVIIYPPAQAWPVRVEAAYFKNVGPEFTGTMRVYGPPEQPTERCGPELAALELFPDHRALQIPDPKSPNSSQP